MIRFAPGLARRKWMRPRRWHCISARPGPANYTGGQCRPLSGITPAPAGTPVLPARRTPFVALEASLHRERDRSRSMTPGRRVSVHHLPETISRSEAVTQPITKHAPDSHRAVRIVRFGELGKLRLGEKPAFNQTERPTADLTLARRGRTQTRCGLILYGFPSGVASTINAKSASNGRHPAGACTKVANMS